MVLTELIVNEIIGFILFAADLAFPTIKEGVYGVILVKILSLVKCTETNKTGMVRLNFNEVYIQTYYP